MSTDLEALRDRCTRALHAHGPVRAADLLATVPPDTAVDTYGDGGVVAELETRVAELRETAQAGSLNIDSEIERLQAKSDRLLRDTYAKLTPWQKTLVARHPERPHFKAYVAGLIEDFVPLAGDRGFGEDKAIVGGLG